MKATLTARPANGALWYSKLEVALRGKKATVKSTEGAGTKKKVIFKGVLNPKYKPRAAKYRGLDEFTGAVLPSLVIDVKGLLVEHTPRKGGRVDLRIGDPQGGGTTFYKIKSIKVP